MRFNTKHKKSDLMHRYFETKKIITLVSILKSLILITRKVSKWKYQSVFVWKYFSNIWRVKSWKWEPVPFPIKKKNTSFQVLTDNFSSYCKYYKWFMHVYYLESQYHDKVVTKENKPVMVAFFVCLIHPVKKHHF